MPSILQFESVSKYIGEIILFEDVNFVLNEGEKSALIGLNGTGKTSLLNLITGMDAPDHGMIEIHTGARIGYLPQDPAFPSNITILEALFSEGNDNLKCIKAYEESLLRQDVPALEKCTAEMDRLKLWDYETRIKQMLTQLNIIQYNQKIAELSGGQLKRVALASSLLNEPDLLLLDEPTNHLDLPVIEWLENYIQRTSMTLLMVTHDRYFLDRVCNVMFEIDQKRVYRYNGNYSRFVEQRQKRIALEALETEKAKNILRKEEDWIKRMPKARGTKAKYRIDNYYKLKEKSEQRRDEKSMQINIRESRMGSKILSVKNLNFRWNDQYYLKDFSYIFNRFEKIGIIGANGSGKTTLLEILTQKIKPESGFIELGETIKIGYYRQEGIYFDEQMKVIDAVTKIAETVTTADGSTITVSQFLNYFLFPYHRQHDYIYKLSGGEKRRLYLCQVLMQNPNFLILDEPTNDLDIASLQVLEDYLAGFNGCVLIVSHDRYFMDSIVDHLFIFEEIGTIRDFPGNYSDYALKCNKQVNTLATGEAKKEKEMEKSGSRQKTIKLSYKEKQEFEQLEKEIATLEHEKAGMEKLLVSGSLSHEELHNISINMGRIIKEIDIKTERWIELSEKEL